MNLKKYRLEKGKTQEELAKELNMPRAKYARYELQTSEPNIETLKKLAEYFHTTIDNLVGHETPYLIDKSQFSDTQLEIIEKIKKLSEETCQRVNAYIEGALYADQQKRNIIELYKGRNNHDDWIYWIYKNEKIILHMSYSF